MKTLTLAAVFSETLAAELSADEMTAVLDRNAQESDSGICHSHDFCDANIYMCEAFEEVMGREPDLKKQTDCDLWGTAWDIAKACEFSPESIRHYFDR